MQLSAWLQENGLTQEAFGLTVGVTQGRIAQLVQGGLPSMGLAIRIEEATGGQVARADWGPVQMAPSPAADTSAEPERAA